MRLLNFLRRNKPMPSFTETQAVQEYHRYQDTVLPNDKMLTFLEWIRETKVVLTDVSADEQAELLTK